MRAPTLAIVAMMALASLGLAQTGDAKSPGPAQAPTLDPRNNLLDWILVNWERKMSGVSSLDAECTYSSIDKTFRRKTVYRGRAKYLRVNGDHFASLELTNLSRPGDFKKIIITGKLLYEFDPRAKVIKVINLPEPKSGKVTDNNLVSFLFGLKAVEAKARYHLRFLKQDKWYYYIEVLPKLAKDKVEFRRARIVLLRSNLLPRQFWFEEANGNENTWDFPRVQTPAPQVRPADFQRPRPPAGWTIRPVKLSGGATP